jgi:hypothetical protein
MEMGLPGQRVTTAIVAAAGIALALLTTSCGAGSSAAVPVPSSNAAVASLSATNVSFGTQSVDASSAAQTVTLSNTGKATLTINSIAVTGTNASDFAQTNTCGSSVAAAANCTIAVIFTPSAVGSRTATLSITDNASGSPQTVALSGSGTAAHYVVLSWTASATAAVVGYNAYRGTASSGPFSQLNSSLINGTNYTDASVQAGKTYYYVVNAMASDEATESANSNVASATVPSP